MYAKNESVLVDTCFCHFVLLKESLIEKEKEVQEKCKKQNHFEHTHNNNNNKSNKNLFWKKEKKRLEKVFD